MPAYYSTLNTPIGILVIEANDKEVCYVGFKESAADESPNSITEKAKAQLHEYFEGKRSSFDLPFAQPGTDFQQEVWKQLTYIPAGMPVSYAALSQKMNNPLAIRAIASANGKNKLMILVPCHRVVGSNGELTGYAWGLWRKRWLLEHEAAMTGTGQATLFL